MHWVSALDGDLRRRPALRLHLASVPVCSICVEHLLRGRRGWFCYCKLELTPVNSVCSWRIGRRHSGVVTGCILCKMSSMAGSMDNMRIEGVGEFTGCHEGAMDGGDAQLASRLPVAGSACSFLINLSAQRRTCSLRRVSSTRASQAAASDLDVHPHTSRKPDSVQTITSNGVRARPHAPANWRPCLGRHEHSRQVRHHFIGIALRMVLTHCNLVQRPGHTHILSCAPQGEYRRMVK